MKAIIISNRLQVAPPIWDVDIFPWASRPSVEGYPIVVLDLYFGEAIQEGFYSLSQPLNTYELGTEVTRCLGARGVVIAMLGPVVVTQRDVQAIPYMRQTNEHKQRRHVREDAPPPGRESSYDWLDQGFLNYTGLDRLHCKPTEGTSWFLPQLEFFHYRSAANRYWVSIKGVEPGRLKREGVITYPIDERQRWGVPSSGNEPITARILAEGAHTHLPVAVALNYLSLAQIRGFFW